MMSPMDKPLLHEPHGAHTLDHDSSMNAALFVGRLKHRVDAHRAIMQGYARVAGRSALREQSFVVSKLADSTFAAAEALVGPTTDPDLEAKAKDEDDASLQTNGEAIVNLLNNCLGSGMLTMGFAMGNAGILPAFFLMLLSAFLNRYTLLLNLSVCNRSGCDPGTAAIGEKAFGVTGRAIMIVLYTVFAFLCCVSYVDASSDAVEGLLELLLGKDISSTQVLLGCWLLLLLPTTLIRSLKSVALLSFVAFIGGCVMLAAVSVYCVLELMTTGLPALSELAWSPPSSTVFWSSFPILLLIFSIQAGGGVVLATMKDTSEKNIRAVSGNSYILVLGMDFTIGIVSYVTFRGDIQGNVLLNFSPDSIIAVVARLALLVLVVLSYMIMMIPCKLSMIDLLYHKNESRMEASTSEFYGVTLTLNVLALCLALSVSDLSLVNGLNGAVCTNLVAFVLPIAFCLAIQRDVEGIPVFSCANIKYFLILAFGCFSLVLGTNQIVQRFLT